MIRGIRAIRGSCLAIGRAVLGAVAELYGIAENRFMRQRSGAVSRALASRQARELTPVTLGELSAAFVLHYPKSVRNPIRRADRALLRSRPLRDEIEAIRQRLLKTETRRCPAKPDPAKPQLDLGPEGGRGAAQK